MIISTAKRSQPLSMTEADAAATAAVILRVVRFVIGMTVAQAPTVCNSGRKKVIHRFPVVRYSPTRCDDRRRCENAKSQAAHSQKTVY